jgi:hypothetical protein
MGAGSSPGVDQPTKVNIAVTYRTVDGIYNHTISGELQTKVQS